MIAVPENLDRKSVFDNEEEEANHLAHCNNILSQMIMLGVIQDPKDLDRFQRHLVWELAYANIRIDRLRKLVEAKLEKHECGRSS